MNVFAEKELLRIFEMNSTNTFYLMLFDEASNVTMFWISPFLCATPKIELVTWKCFVYIPTLCWEGYAYVKWINVGENHSNHFYNYKQDEIPYNGTLDIENVIEPRVKTYEMRMCTVYTSFSIVILIEFIHWIGRP